MDRPVPAALPESVPALTRLDRLILLAGAAVYLALLPLAFGRAGDAVVDSFHDLVTVMRISHGEVLYRDIAFLYGPMGPLTVWLWTALAGLTVKSYLVLCALLAAAELWLALKIARRYLAPLGCLLLLLALLFGFTFQSELFSRLMPYSFSAFLAATGFLLFLDRLLAAREGSLIAAFTGGLVAGLLLHTKLEFGLAALGTAGLDLATERIFYRRHEPVTRHQPHLWAGILLGAGFGFIVVNSLGASLSDYAVNVDPRPFLSSPAGKALARTAGGISSFAGFLNFLRQAGVSLALAVMPAAFVWWAGTRNHRSALLSAVLAGVFLLAAAGAPGGFGAALEIAADYTILAGVIPLLLLAAAALARDRQDLEPGGRTKFILAAAGLALLARTPNALSPGLFGAFYLLPGTVLAVSLSGWWGCWFSDSSPRRSGQAVAAGLLVFCLPGFVQNLDRFRFKEYAPAEDLMPFATDGRRAKVIGETIAFLRTRMKPGDPFAALPQEPVLYFALEAKPVFPDHNFIAHVVRGEPMEQLARQLESTLPAYVAVSNRAYREGGLGGFGTTYAREIQEVLSRRYRVAKTFGSPSIPPGHVSTGGLGDPLYAITVWELKPD